MLFCAAYSGIANFSSLFNVLSLTRRIRAERNTGVPSRGLPLAVGAISPSVLSLAAVLALAVGVSFTFTDTADAWGGCRAARACGGAVLVPTPQPIPLRPVRVLPAPCTARPCGPRAYWYQPTRVSAYYAQPAYATSCVRTPGNYHWRRDCRYDSFGRRLCN